MKLSFGFVTRGLPFNGDTINKQSLGGSETALICIARELAKRGHSVEVFCQCPEPGVFDGVTYFNYEDFSRVNAAHQYNVLIVSRFFQYLSLPSFAGLRVLWLHDVPVEKELLMASLWQTDLVMTLSDYHTKLYTDACPELEDHIWQTSNGVDIDLIETCRMKKVPNKLIYTSRPERGLHYLLTNIFPQMLEKNPDLQLSICNYSIDGLANISPEASALIRSSEALVSKFPNNITVLGNLTKPELYSEISSAQLHLYPTDFPEISCITAMEAQACGTPIITTADFALTETVGKGTNSRLIDGSPAEEDYCRIFASVALELLEKEAKTPDETGMKRVVDQGYTWARVAESWEKNFEMKLQERWNTNRLGVVQELIRHGDLIPARSLSEKHNLDQEEFIDSYITYAQSGTFDLSGIAESFRESLGRFAQVAQLMMSEKVPVTSLLDYGCGDTSFGLYFKKNVPDCEVTIFDPNEIVLQRVAAYADKSEIEVTLKSDSLMEGAYDVVFIGDLLDSVYDPLTVLADARSLLSDNGKIVFTTRSGATSATLGVLPDKLWNFSFNDFCTMFGDTPDFNATFLEENVSEGGDLVGHWIGILGKDGKIEEPNFEFRTKFTRPYESISCCLIVKDEEDSLRACLKSVLPIVDEIIVADTGSTDRTKEIAEEYATKVIDIEFDNFSQVRNASIKDAMGSWIFWLDADEKLVNSHRIRKYLYGKIFQGFVLRQNHLMLDMQGTFDTPVRIFRNLPHYKFTGLIHEHCEDISKGPYDNPIHPSLILPDSDLVHYGYLTEKTRRIKCSNRNMTLLSREAEENTGRRLTWVLVLRDYLNIVNWNLDGTDKVILEGSKNHTLLNGAVTTYLDHFQDVTDQYHSLSFPMYQQALEFLGKSGLCYANHKHPPFEVALSLNGGIGGIQNKNIAPECIWFVDREHCLNFLNERSTSLVTALGLNEDGKYQIPNATYTAERGPVDPLKLLGLGKDVMRD